MHLGKLSQKYCTAFCSSLPSLMLKQLQQTARMEDRQWSAASATAHSLGAVGVRGLYTRGKEILGKAGDRKKLRNFLSLKKIGFFQQRFPMQKPV